jgi:hypothetical protein
MDKRRDAGLASSRATWFRVTAVASSAALLGMLGLAGTSFAATGSVARAAAPAKAATLADDSASTCHLGNGVKHVVQITFDNVHFFRDNPNVPSDFQLMPNLLNFFTSNGTILSNNHTPLIAHTADDILTTLTGLYGDRQGMPISNDYQAYNTDGPNGTFGTTSSAGSFAYWTDPVYYSHGLPAGGDTNPNMVYSPVPPATASAPVTPNTITPAPWVPFTRAGCDVGDFSTANIELENTSVDIPKVFGPNSPEAQQLAADKDSFKDAETADYVGVAVHCAQGSAFCADAKGVKYGQTTATPTAVTDSLPSEPGGYTGFQALFGARYVAPQLGAGTANLSHNGYQVTNAAGNLVDLNGQQINGAFLTNHPGFPGFDPTASQTLAYAADMLEAGLPVVQSYIADLHGLQSIPSLDGPGGPCYNAPDALGSGSACYLAQAAYYNQAFGTFFKRLAADGINTSNTLFIVSSDEGDHEAGANVGRAIQPTPANCDGVTTACTYPAGTFGELAGNVTGLLAQQKHNTTAFGMEFDTAPEYYINGNPGPDAGVTRTFEHDVAGLTAFNPYAGKTQPIANYLADPAEEAILHMVNADPARTPTLAEFAKPDYYLSQGSATCTDTTGLSSSDCVQIDNGFAWDHGDYAAEINTNYVGFAGPGVKNLGVDGPQPADGPNSAGPNSGQTVVADSGTTGTWVDETDIRPTMMYLTGLKDDYEHDGRVITQILADPGSALSGSGVAALGACYKQLNSSVGQFANYTLQADTKAIEGSSQGDILYRDTDKVLSSLDKVRDAVALKIKAELEAAAFQNQPIFAAGAQAFSCQAIINSAALLAHNA